MNTLCLTIHTAKQRELILDFTYLKGSCDPFNLWKVPWKKGQQPAEDKGASREHRGGLGDMRQFWRPLPLTKAFIISQHSQVPSSLNWIKLETFWSSRVYYSKLGVDSLFLSCVSLCIFLMLWYLSTEAGVMGWPYSQEAYSSREVLIRALCPVRKMPWVITRPCTSSLSLCLGLQDPAVTEKMQERWKATTVFCTISWIPL